MLPCAGLARALSTLSGPHPNTKRQWTPVSDHLQMSWAAAPRLLAWPGAVGRPRAWYPGNLTCAVGIRGRQLSVTSGGARLSCWRFQVLLSRPRVDGVRAGSHGRAIEVNRRRHSGLTVSPWSRPPTRERNRGVDEAQGVRFPGGGAPGPGRLPSRPHGERGRTRTLQGGSCWRLGGCRGPRHADPTPRDIGSCPIVCPTCLSRNLLHI